MNKALTEAQPHGFTQPDEALGRLDVRITMELVTRAADVTLLLDPKGVIQDIAYNAEGLAEDKPESWIGQPWLDVVTIESRPKIEDLLSDEGEGRAFRWRQVNHPSPTGTDLPVRYVAMAAKVPGWSVAIGRDLRQAARLQQRLVTAQQALEHDYALLRDAESRYQALFQMSSEGILVVRSQDLRIADANAAAGAALGENTARLEGRSLTALFDQEGGRRVQDMLTVTRSIGAGDPVAVTLADGVRTLTVSASLFRQTGGAIFLVRVSPPQAQNTVAPMTSDHVLPHIVRALPDGFVVTDMEMRILTANEAFLDLAQVASERQACAMSLRDFLGRSRVDLDVLLANLREHGVLRSFATTLTTIHGLQEDVDVSAVVVPASMHPCCGFTMRSVARRPAVTDAGLPALPASVEQLTELVGRVSLKEIVRETTDLIERLCLEAALSLTNDNRASAAEMLGLSRQSLYSKLHRYGLSARNPD